MTFEFNVWNQFLIHRFMDNTIKKPKKSEPSGLRSRLPGEQVLWTIRERAVTTAQ